MLKYLLNSFYAQVINLNAVFVGLITDNKINAALTQKGNGF